MKFSAWIQRIGPNADVNVQRHVAVDYIVATITNDDVTAAATKDDIAGAEGGDVLQAKERLRRYAGRQDRRPGRAQLRPEGIVEELLQTVDQRDVGQHAADGAAVTDHTRGRNFGR